MSFLRKYHVITFVFQIPAMRFNIIPIMRIIPIAILVIQLFPSKQSYHENSLFYSLSCLGIIKCSCHLASCNFESLFKF